MSPTPPRCECAFDAAAALGPVTILVNNAGVPSGSFFTKTSEEEWRSVLAVNLDGVFRVGQEAARRMVANGAGGSIINIASLLGFGVIKTLSTYRRTKAAVVSLTKSMALELARDKIRVNALAPGYFSTEINDAFLASETGKRLLSGVPMKRAGELEELDGPLLLLASDAGTFMTGSVITVDGGYLLGDGVMQGVIPALVAGIQRSSGSGARGRLDTGDEPRYDNRCDPTPSG